VMWLSVFKIRKETRPQGGVLTQETVCSDKRPPMPFTLGLWPIRPLGLVLLYVNDYSFSNIHSPNLLCSKDL
jgi:hypothetical protein